MSAAVAYDYNATMKQRSDALDLLKRKGVDAASVWRVYGAGDSDIVRGGVLREAILYRDSHGVCKTAVLSGAGCSDVEVAVEDGW